MDVMCNMPQRPSRGLVWSSSADWLLCWSCGWRTPLSCCSSKRDLVGGPVKVHESEAERAGEEKSMHGFCEIPDPVVSVDENCFYLFV